MGPSVTTTTLVTPSFEDDPVLGDCARFVRLGYPHAIERKNMQEEKYNKKKENSKKKKRSKFKPTPAYKSGTLSILTLQALMFIPLIFSLQYHRIEIQLSCANSRRLPKICLKP